MTIEVIRPEGFVEPLGYADGMLCRGSILFVAGQVGWNGEGHFVSDEFIDQFSLALDNVVAVLKAAGASPSAVVRMTIYVTKMQEYRSNLKLIGAEWRKRFGKHYPAMALVGVTELVQPQALVEIEATACIEPESK